MNTATIAPVYLAVALLAQAPTGGPSGADAAADRLKFMQDLVQSYEITTSGDRAGKLKLQEKPVFRLGKQYAEDIVDGAIFLAGGRGWSELRLLPTPIARYEDSRANLLDGALYAFVLGTDPEVFLFLEARSGKEGVEWQYALAPMTVFAVKGLYRGKAVWELPDRQSSWDPSKPFFDKADGR